MSCPKKWLAVVGGAGPGLALLRIMMTPSIAGPEPGQTRSPDRTAAPVVPKRGASSNSDLFKTENL